MGNDLTVREIADAIVYGRDELPGLIDILKQEPLQHEILEGVVVRLITHLRHHKEMRHFRTIKRKRALSSSKNDT